MDFWRWGKRREAHLRCAMNAGAESVVLVAGSHKVDRDPVFNGSNTPLLPDILICTQVERLDRPDRYEPHVKKRRRNHSSWLTEIRGEIKRKMAKGVNKN